MPLTATITRETDTSAPLEGQDVTSGGTYANFRASMAGTLGASLETKAIGAGAAALGIGSALVPYDQAVAHMQQEKLDPSVLAKGQPVSTAMLHSIMNQQISIQENSDRANRAHLGTVSSFVSSFAGGATDPIFLALGPIASRVAPIAEAAVGIKGLSLAARVGTGAAEGSAIAGAYDVGESKFGSAQGDRDITDGRILHDMVWGGIIGGGLKGAFGERPAPAPDVSTHLSMIENAENSAHAAKLQGVDISQVVSKKGAIGRYQIEPDTARQYMGKNYDVSKLKDDAENTRVAQTIMKDLHNKFGDDPEALAVAWNAGPGVARKFVRAGYDRSMLPKETRDYLQRIDQTQGRAVFSTKPLTPEVEKAAGTMAVHQMADDGAVNVEPIIRQGEAEQEAKARPGINAFTIADEHDAEMQSIYSEALTKAGAGPESLADAIPKPGSVFTRDPEIAARIEAMKPALAEMAKPTVTDTGKTVNPEMTALEGHTKDAIAEAEHAHMVATGVGAEAEANALHTRLAEEDEITKNDSELAKAIDAAVRCSALKGLS